MENVEVSIKPRCEETKNECTNCGKKSTKEAFFGNARTAFCDSKSCEKIATDRVKVMGS